MLPMFVHSYKRCVTYIVTKPLSVQPLENTMLLQKCQGQREVFWLRFVLFCHFTFFEPLLIAKQ